MVCFIVDCGGRTMIRPSLRRANALVILTVFAMLTAFSTAKAQQSDDFETLSQQVVSLYFARKYAEATEPANRALALAERQLGPDHPKVREALNILAGLYEAQGRYPEAEPLYKRALAIAEKALGPDHPDVSRDLNNLAGLYDAQGRYAEAEPL
jgi:tetratricopeptide (TPR) repeat protein